VDRNSAKTRASTAEIRGGRGSGGQAKRVVVDGNHWGTSLSSSRQRNRGCWFGERGQPRRRNVARLRFELDSHNLADN
jgi:hypothetical protein